MFVLLIIVYGDGPFPRPAELPLRIVIQQNSLSTGVGVRLVAVGVAGRTIICLDRGIQLLVGDSVSAQLSGADLPSALFLIELSTGDVLDIQSSVYSTVASCRQVSNSLNTIIGYFVQVGILVSCNPQSTSAVESGLGGEGQEVDVCIGIQISDLLVVLEGELQVQSRLTTGINLEPGSLVITEVENYVLSIVALQPNGCQERRSTRPQQLHTYRCRIHGCPERYPAGIRW